MVVDWLSIGIQTSLIAGLLVAFLLSFRLLATNWIKMAFARWMKSLSEAAEEEGTGVSSSSPGAGVLKLGGFSIDVRTIKEILPIIPQLMEAAKMFGLLKGGGATGGGYIRP